MNKPGSMDENEFFRQATLRICSSLNPDKAIEKFLHYIKDYFPVTGMNFGLLDRSESLLIIPGWASLDNAKRPTSVLHLPEILWDRIYKSWDKQEKFMIINDTGATEPRVRDFISLAWPSGCSMIIMIIDKEGKRIGSIGLWAKGPNRYTEEHLRILSMLEEPIAIAISNATNHQVMIRAKEALADDYQYLHKTLLNMSGDTIVGTSGGLKHVMEMVHQVAGLDSPVLLLGETGVGKEVIANTLHQTSHRKSGPFITVNCGAIPETLMDSELFGHEKGAFTGAVRQNRGRFERAHLGTIFLDEIGELPLAAQVRLLHVLQDKKIERVGGSSPVPIDVRIISATHRNLEQLVRQGRFREDLWFRLNVFPIMIPPLRQRKGDIPALVRHFIHRKSTEMKLRKKPTFKPEDLESFYEYDWPGNVRELENLVERTLIQTRGRSIVVQPPQPLNAQPRHQAVPESSGILGYEDLCRAHFKKVLDMSAGRIEGPGGAAQLLKLKPGTLRAKLKKLGVPYGRIKKGF